MIWQHIARSLNQCHQKSNPYEMDICAELRQPCTGSNYRQKILHQFARPDIALDPKRTNFEKNEIGKMLKPEFIEPPEMELALPIIFVSETNERSESMLNTGIPMQ